MRIVLHSSRTVNPTLIGTMVTLNDGPTGNPATPRPLRVRQQTAVFVRAAKVAPNCKHSLATPKLKISHQIAYYNAERRHSLVSAHLSTSKPIFKKCYNSIRLS